MQKKHYQPFLRSKNSLQTKWVVLLIACLSFSTLAVNAQTINVKGTVTDEAGVALIGVSIGEKGSDKGTISDVDGKFSLQVEQDKTLLFSYVGYKQQEIAVSTSPLKVVMIDTNKSLDAVVVMGYGVQKKKLITGATVQISGDDLRKMSSTNALQALQGQTPGVNITSTSGQPGDALKVTVRGLGTIGDASPLYIVDGVQTGDITYLNNADIASIDVLKDAASAAIYGSRAANGVVLITTRAGKKGAHQITFDMYYGVQNVPHKIGLLNATEYETILNEAAVNSGKPLVYSLDQVAAAGAGTNWMNEMFSKNAPTQNYSIGLSGGDDVSTYSTSLSYTSQAGIVGGANESYYSRYGFRTNSDHKFFGDLLRIGENVTFSYINQNGIKVGNAYNNALRSAFTTTPLLPMYDDNGNYYDDTTNKYYGAANPYANMVYNNQNASRTQKLVGNIYAEFQPIKNLKIKTLFGLDNEASDYRSFTPIYHLSLYAYSTKTSVNQNMSRGVTWNWDNTATYSCDLNPDNHFDAMIGTSARKYTGSYLSAGNSNLIFSDFDHAWISNATNTDGATMSMSGFPQDKDMLLSYFGRVGYNYKETYLLNATFRTDGSSKFAKGNQWGYFPSISAGWVMTNEKFMEGVKSWMDFFKLRASWGQNGNQNISAFNYLALIQTTDARYNFGNTEGVNTSGSFPSRLANDNLKWETSEQLDFGFDSRFFQGKLNATFDWYQKTTKNWLIVAPIYATAGTGAPYTNGGNVINSGIELGLNYTDYMGDLHYTIAGNVAYNQNKVVDVPTADGIIHGQPNQVSNNFPEFYRVQSGMPIGYFYGYQATGVFQNEAQIQNYKNKAGQLLQPTAQPGDVIFADTNHDGVINASDETKIGNPNPPYTFGLTLSLSYKGWDFMVSTSGVAGNQIFQSYRSQSSQYDNYTTAILDRWHGEGTSNTMPRVTQDNRNWLNPSSLYIQDGSYLRIQNITLGYDLKNILKAKVFSQLRVFGTVQNLFTLTKYNGMDPEVGYGSDSFASGIDAGYYPHPRTTMIGLNVKF